MPRRPRRPAAPTTLPPEKWAEAGIFLLAWPDGVRRPSHALGDQYADAVIDGRIDYEQAKRNHHEGQVRFDRMTRRHVPTLFDHLLRLTR